MSLNGNDTYLILNYSPSAVSISTRDTSYLIPGGSATAPSAFPLTLNEIRYINNVSEAFKCGLLFFEDGIAEAMYDELHIPDWRSILRDDDIEQILTDPTVDGLERLLAITKQIYFERVYGVYVGMKNAGIPVSSKVEQLLTTRRKELARGKSTTDLSVRRVSTSSQTDEKIKALEDQIAQLTALLTAQQNAPAPQSDEKIIKDAHDPVVNDTPKAASKTSKPASKPRQSKSKAETK